MTGAFSASPGGGVHGRLEPVERRVLAALAGDLARLLRPDPAADPTGLGILAEAGISADPVMARLLPDAYADAEAAVEFRRYTEQSLREHKAVALEALVRSLETEHDLLALDAAQARAWLSGLNDLRLALGTRMGLGVDGVEDVDADVPEPVAALYDWLTWLQDGLITALLPAADTLAP